jgi:basic membrane protein A
MEDLLMKKNVLTVIAIVLVVAMMASLVAVFAGCNGDNTGKENELKALNTSAVSSTLNADSGANFGSPVAKANLKVGLITLHDENSTYDANFIDAFKAATAELGLAESQIIIKTGVDEDSSCYTTATDLVNQGCQYIFADSFGHESFMKQAAQENPTVQFCHATGTSALTAGLNNFHNAFASIYEGRYLAGVAAGLKLKAMMTADSSVTPKVGYVGAWPYAEVKSGYTSFFLGIRSIVPTATMDVKFTNSWYDEVKEKESAESLIAGGCVLISQHADSYGAPSACEAANVPNVSYNGSTEETCPNTFIVSSRINWAPYFKYSISCVMNGKNIATDWCGTIATGSVELTAVGAKAAVAGTQAEIDTVKAKLQSGALKVFDTSKFTVNGATLTEYAADVIDMGDFQPETNAIVGGAFLESVGRSAPYFDINIDGITIK